MNPVARRWWSRVAWTFSVAMFFALQFYAVSWLARVPSTRALAVKSGPTTRLWMPQDPSEELSLAGRQRLPPSAGREALSFSRAAERALPSPEYRLDEVTAAPRWLAADAGLRLASPLAPLRPVASPRLPDSLPPASPNTVSAGVMATQTVVFVKGDLARRPWSLPVRLPVWTNAEPLRPTIIEIAVNPRGDVLVPTLISGSGDKAADAVAIETVRQARLQPLKGTPPDGLAWGRLVIQWVTSPPQPAAAFR